MERLYMKGVNCLCLVEKENTDLIGIKKITFEKLHHIFLCCCFVYKN